MPEPRAPYFHFRRGPFILSGLQLPEFDTSSIALHIGPLVFNAERDRNTTSIGVLTLTHRGFALRVDVR
jgi:hypothetical protein